MMAQHWFGFGLSSAAFWSRMTSGAIVNEDECIGSTDVPAALVYRGTDTMQQEMDCRQRRQEEAHGD
jgi:hypothetical protein